MLRQRDGQPTFASITQQGEHGRGFLSTAQHVCSPRNFEPYVGIRQIEDPACQTPKEMDPSK